ncbi:hypothetical protein CTEN210_14952 [Chaetoceros tenuissimus]|uniref:MYND-type domain-containing protein n=1 Tax=Chaetoceros tenuissimus TaxID=426638 RepID=A0AAD3D871_9STRA|nr:hypothetical protein CTEN210_14952 [Chaetoceros tenuissimus]
MLKQGFPFHNALLDILQGRIRPCKENEFVMADLYTLGRFIDLTCFKPIDAHIPNPAIAIFRHTCTKCRTVDHSKQLLVCARCKFVPYCSKECQVKDWKDHKADCKKFQNEEYKKDKKFNRKFFTKHQNLITEKVKAASVETGLETTELFIDLDFSCSGHDIPPALQDIPKIQIVTDAKDFLNEGEKRFIDAMSSKLGKNSVMVCVSFVGKVCLGVVHLALDTYGEILFMTGYKNMTGH